MTTEGGFQMESTQHTDKCHNCRSRHDPHRCPAKGKECHTCGRVDHFANAPACPRRRVTSHTTRKLSEEEESSGTGDSAGGTYARGSQRVRVISVCDGDNTSSGTEVVVDTNRWVL